MTTWTEIHGVAELPEGNWLVEVQEEIYGSIYHTASKCENCCFLAGHFAFDMPTIIAYAPIPTR